MPERPYNRTRFCRLLRAARYRTDLTQRAFAVYYALPARSWVEWEQGIRLPRTEVLRQLAAYPELRLDLRELKIARAEAAALRKARAKAETAG